MEEQISAKMRGCSRNETCTLISGTLKQDGAGIKGTLGKKLSSGAMALLYVHPGLCRAKYISINTEMLSTEK